jgi:hypothetical protein
MERKAAERRVGEEAISDGKGACEKKTAWEDSADGAVAGDTGAGADKISTGDPCPRTRPTSETVAPSNATPVAGGDRLRQRGCGDDEHRRSGTRPTSETVAPPNATPVAGGDHLRQRGCGDDEHRRSGTRPTSETVAPPNATPVTGGDHLRQRGSDRDERPRGCDDLAFRALCGMGFRAHEARRALGRVGQLRAGEPPAAIATLLREALAVLAP